MLLSYSSNLNRKSKSKKTLRSIIALSFLLLGLVVIYQIFFFPGSSPPDQITFNSPSPTNQQNPTPEPPSPPNQVGESPDPAILRLEQDLKDIENSLSNLDESFSNIEQGMNYTQADLSE